MLLYRWVNIFRGGVFGRKKKKKDKSGVFFYSCFIWVSFLFFKTPLKKLELKFKVISQCKLLNLTLVSVVKKAGTRASEKKGFPILEQENR